MFDNGESDGDDDELEEPHRRIPLQAALAWLITCDFGLTAYLQSAPARTMERAIERFQAEAGREVKRVRGLDEAWSALAVAAGANRVAVWGRPSVRDPDDPAEFEPISEMEEIPASLVCRLQCVDERGTVLGDGSIGLDARYWTRVLLDHEQFEAVFVAPVADRDLPSDKLALAIRGLKGAYPPSGACPPGVGRQKYFEKAQKWLVEREIIGPGVTISDATFKRAIAKLDPK